MSDENTNENTAVSAQKLDIGGTLTDGINITIKNIGPILVNLLLWIVTIWIPYFNVGTTIGLFSGVVIKASRDETISYTEVFAPKYRKYMGNYFLTAGFIFIGVFVGIFFLIVPGIILSIAWGFALILIIDKEIDPSVAIKLSNDITYGYKGRIFLVNFIVSVIFSIVQAILSSFDNDFATFLVVITVIIQLLLTFGIQASMYKQLGRDN